MIDSLMVCCAIHVILPRCCKQWLRCERSLHRWVVICLGLFLHVQLEWSLHHLLPYWLSANAHVSWRRVLRTPPHLPFLGRGVPQVREEHTDLEKFTKLAALSLSAHAVHLIDPAGQPATQPCRAVIGKPAEQSARAI